MTELELPEAALLRRHRGYLAMGLAPWGIGVGLAFAAWIAGTAAFLVATPHLAIVGLLTLLHVLRANPAATPEPGGVRVDAEGVHAGGRLVVGREELHQGFVSPGDEGVTVVLQRRGRGLPVSIRVPDTATGDRLLGALGLAAHQRSASVRIVGGYADWSLARQMALFLLPTLVALAIGLPSVAHFGHPALLLGLLVPVVAAVAAGLSPRSLDIGAEGLHLRWLGREELLRFEDVSAIGFSDVRLGGKEFRVMRLEGPRGPRAVTLAQRGFGDHLVRAIEARVSAAFEAFRARPSAPIGQTTSALERGDADPSAWVTRLRRLGAGGAEGLRELSIPREVLVRIVEDPGQRDADRAAAAVALREGAAPDVRERLRIAAQTTASPRLRIALERAADEDTELEALEDALATIDEPSRERRRRR